MATTNAQIDISVNGLEKLDKLQTGLNTVTAKFSGFKTMIAGLGIAALGKGILQMADDLDDLSQVTGIATTTLLEFKQALELSGGKGEQLPKMLQKFSLVVDEAAQGSAQAQLKFLELGLSLDEVAKMGTAERFVAVLDAIGKLTDKSRQAAYMMEFAGKAGLTVAPAEMAQRIRDLTGSQSGLNTAMTDAKRLNEELTKASEGLKLVLLETFAPAIKYAADFAESLKNNKDQLDNLVSVLKTIASVVAFAFAFTAVGAAVRVIGTIGRGVGSLIGLFSSFGGAVGKVFSANGGVMTALRGVGGLIAGIAASIGTVLGLTKPSQEKPKTPEAEKPKTEEELKAEKDAAAKAAEDAKWSTKELDRSYQKVREITSEYESQRKIGIDRFNLETKLIGVSEEERNYQLGKFDLEQSYNNLINETIKKRENLGQKEQYLTATYLEQEKAQRKNKEEALAAYDQTNSKRTMALYLEKERQVTIDQINESLKRQAAFSDTIVGLNDKLKEIEFEGKIQGLDDVSKQIARINEEGRLGALAAGRAIAAQYEGLDLSTAQSETLAGRLAEVDKYYKRITETNIANLQSSRTFASGWKSAFNSYVDSAKNASEQAKNFFNKTLSGMEDLIVNFAKTGKFEWKSFVASMAEELLRSQIRQSFATIMSGMQNSMGGGGIMDTISGLLGFGGAGANTKGQSANNPLYVLDIAGGGAGGGQGGVFGQQGGQGGGGIFSGISNVFSGIKDTFSNITNSVGNIFSGISDSVGSIFGGGGGGGGGGFFDSITSGFSSLFDGFFANGGNIGAGKFGIVGENGPEFVGGPASVTPMGGQSVTYNINAVDAASFKSLIAADPGFIHAVAMAGANSIPGRR
jgi:lambda family phage tail tape measure protein